MIVRLWRRAFICVFLAFVAHGLPGRVHAQPFEGQMPAQAATPPSGSNRDPGKGGTPPTVRVISPRTTIWSTPSLPVAMTIVPAGTILEVLGLQDEWYRPLSVRPDPDWIRRGTAR
jgi:hypothetical protein